MNTGVGCAPRAPDEDFDGLLVFCTIHVATQDADTAREVFGAACAALDIQEEPDPAFRFGDGEFGLGDFAAALRQAWFRDVRDAAGLRACLEAERRARDEQRGRPIGFAAPLSV